MTKKYYTGIGSRDTPNDVLKVMIAYAKEMRKKGFTLRSGGADGADMAFEAGAGDLKEIYLPWRLFNGNTSSYYPPKQYAYLMAQNNASRWGNLKGTTKALYARNVHQVLGWDLNQSSDLIVCWTKKGDDVGGTGFTIRLARSYLVPIFNLYHKEDARRLNHFLETI